MTIEINTKNTKNIFNNYNKEALDRQNWRTMTSALCAGFSTMENDGDMMSTTGSNPMKIQTFVNSCLRRILKIQWPDSISNLELWKQTSQIAVREEFILRKWRWLGHTFRKPTTIVARHEIT
jgi:hypothetical protein